MSSFRFFLISWFLGTSLFYVKIKYDISHRNYLIYEELKEIRSRLEMSEGFNYQKNHSTTKYTEINKSYDEPFSTNKHKVQEIQKDFLIEFLIDSYISKSILIPIIKLIDFTKNSDLVKLIEKLI